MGIAIVVPGSGRVGRDGVYRITNVCRELVREAERLTAARGATTVVLSGWSPTGGTSEAEQMRDAWQGPDVELVVEPTASFTAQNASRTLPLLLERGVRRALVICTPLNVRRTRLFFSRLYEPAGIETELRLVQIGRSPVGAVRELVARSFVRAQLRAAEAEVARIRSRS
jgi:uncharacterized SAM-binding protein YcdF (DUF218 family)